MSPSSRSGVPAWEEAVPGAGFVYGICALALSGAFVVLAIQVLRDQGQRAAKRMFAFSILYLFVLFALLILDRASGLAA